MFRPNGKYFITGATYLKTKYFTSDVEKSIVFECIYHGCEKYKWHLEDWVILDNHYHVMLNAPENADSLSKMMKEIHVFASMRLRKQNESLRVERKIFHNYWDSCISFDRSYYSRLNYIYANPVKHGYVQFPEEYEWGSYKLRLEKSAEYLKELQEKYLCDKVKVADEF